MLVFPESYQIFNISFFQKVWHSSQHLSKSVQAHNNELSVCVVSDVVGHDGLDKWLHFIWRHHIVA